MAKYYLLEPLLSVDITKTTNLGRGMKSYTVKSVAPIGSYRIHEYDSLVKLKENMKQIEERNKTLRPVIAAQDISDLLNKKSTGGKK